MMHWEIQQGSDVSGPFSEDEILMMVEAGRIDADTMVRPEGKQAWKPATRHGRFAAALRAVAAAHDEAPGGPATTAGGRGDAGAGPDTARSRRAPIDGIPFKDPARWDQQTQLGMPVATLLPGGVPAAVPEPKAASSSGVAATNGAGAAASNGTGTAATNGAGAAATNGAGPTSGAGGAVAGGPPPLPVGSHGALSPAVAPPSQRVVASSTVAAQHHGAARPRAEGGVVSGLFDFGFTTFITARLARVLYVLHVVLVLAAFVVGCVIGVGAVQTALRLDSQAMLLAGAAQLLATPIVCLCALILGRVVAESVVVFFRVAEHLGEIDRKTPG